MKTTTLALIAASTLTSACLPSILDPEAFSSIFKNDLELRYDANDEIERSNKPVAVGAKLGLRIYEAGAKAGEVRGYAEVLEVSSSDPAVLEVSESGGNMFIVTAKSAGTAQLSIKARIGSTGEEVEHSVSMTAQVPERVAISHTCRAPSERSALYLPNQLIELPFEMKMKDGQGVIGDHYYPLSFDPPDALMINTEHKDHAFVHIVAGELMGPVTLSSPLDPSASYTMEFVQEAAIDGAALALHSKSTIATGKTELFKVLPTFKDQHICQANIAFTVVTKTPEVCDVYKLRDYLEEPQNKLTSRHGWLEAKGKMVGDCVFTVTYLAGAEGAGASTDLTIPVQDLWFGPWRTPD
jgi:hypothetical protein